MSGHKGKQVNENTNTKNSYNKGKQLKEHANNVNDKVKANTPVQTQANSETVNLIAPFHKNTILVTIGGRKTPALVDTGVFLSNS